MTEPHSLIAATPRPVQTSLMEGGESPVGPIPELGLRVHDLVVHAAGSGPGGSQITTVKRTRRAHSYLVVFEARRRPRSRRAA